MALVGLIIPGLIKIRLERGRNKGAAKREYPDDGIDINRDEYNCELIESAVKCDPSKSLNIVFESS